MITAVASIKVKKNHLSQFVIAFKRLVPQVLAEEGCIEYYPTVDTGLLFKIQSVDDHRVTIIEKWQSIQSLQEHANTEHMQAFASETDQMIEDFNVRILKAV